MTTPTLFPEPQPAPVEVSGHFAVVAVEDSLDKLLDYAIPTRLLNSLRAGQRVRVPLGRGNRPAHGYVIAIRAHSQHATTKPLLAIDDQRVLLTSGLMELALWMSRYYVAPLGAVIDSVIPSAVKKKVGMGYVNLVRLAKPAALIQEMLEKTKAKKRRAILARLLQLGHDQAIDLIRLAAEANVAAATVRRLATLGILTITSEADMPGLTADIEPTKPSEADIQLNEEQQQVFNAMLPKLSPTAAVAAPLPAPENPHFNPPPEYQGRNPDERSEKEGSPVSPPQCDTIPLPSKPRELVPWAPPPGGIAHRDSDATALSPAPLPPAGFSVTLIHGVTGSGKTEVYLQCIRRVVEQGRQAIVLVPEIALTPQTVRRFTARFSRVAILHSGLGNSQRHRFWQMIASGGADVVVGARSAVFAPLPRLGIIVVDEEHEPSYKQDTAPRYHGRDVAIKRAQIENVPVILGSATPSLETYWKVSSYADARNLPRISPSPGTPGECQGGGNSAELSLQGNCARKETGEQETGEKAAPAGNPASPTYALLRLPHRVRGLAMPAVELIDMKLEARMRRGVHLLSQRLENSLHAAVGAGHQAILLLNRRGYSNFVYCASCQEPTKCNYCSTTMTYHRSTDAGMPGARTAAGLHTGQLHCHYCLAVSPLPAACPACGKQLTLFGLGTQRVEEELARKFPGLTYARVDSDTMRSSKDYEALLGRFAHGEIQVMLGTQMIAKGLDYPNVTLVGVISGDTALALPDFRAAERTYQLITQVAGRAGRGDAPGRVVLQSFMPQDPTIQAALRQDFVGFANGELTTRREVGLPPFARMCRIILRDESLDKLGSRAEELGSEIAQIIAVEAPSVKLKGPMPCAIERIAGYFRYQIVLSAPRADALQRVLAKARDHKHLASGQRVAVDVDPVSLL